MLNKKSTPSIKARIKAAKPVNIRRFRNTWPGISRIRVPLKIRRTSSLEKESDGLGRLLDRLEGTPTMDPLHSTTLMRDIQTIETLKEKIDRELKRRGQSISRSAWLKKRTG